MLPPHAKSAQATIAAMSPVRATIAAMSPAGVMVSRPSSLFVATAVCPIGFMERTDKQPTMGSA
jgi:hypothetical protein